MLARSTRAPPPCIPIVFLAPLCNALKYFCVFVFCAVLQVAYDKLGIDTAESKVNFDAQLAQSVLDAGDMRAQLAESAVAAGGMRAQLEKSALDAGDMRAQLDKSELDSGVMKVEHSASSYV